MISKLKQKIYWYFAEKNANVRREYEPYVKSHPHKYEGRPWKRWCLLIRLNWWHRVCGHSRSLVWHGASRPVSSRPALRLPYLEGAESTLSKRRPIIYFVKDLLTYDIISFDIFDTLILRPFARPDDLFMIVGNRLGVPEFYRIRKEAEEKARNIASIINGIREVTIHDIYKIIEDRSGIPAEKGIQVEFEVELEYCFANPYILSTWHIGEWHMSVQKCSRENEIVF